MSWTEGRETSGREHIIHHRESGWDHFHQGDFQRAQECFRKECWILEHDSPVSLLALARSYGNLGLVCKKQNLCNDALRYYVKAVEIQERKVPDSLNLAVTYHNLGVVSKAQNNFDDALRYYKLALSIKERKVPHSLDLANTYNSLCRVYESQHRFDDALSYYQMVMTIREELASDSLDLARTYHNLGSVHYNKKHLDDALVYFEKELSIVQEQAADSLELAITYNNMGRVYDEQKQFDNAVRYYEMALSIRQRKAPDSLDLAITNNNLGCIYDNQDRFDDALRHYEMALSVLQKIAPDSLELGITFNNIGRVYYKQNLWDYAQRYLQSSIAIRERTSPDSLDLAHTYHYLGFVYDRKNQMPDAKRCHEKADLIQEKKGSSDLMDWAYAYDEWAGEFCAIRNEEEAMKYYFRELEIYRSQAPSNPYAAGIERKINAIEIGVIRAKIRQVMQPNGVADPVKVPFEYVDLVNTKVELGKGFFGVVFKGTDHDLKASFAIKVIHQHLIQHANSQDVMHARTTFQIEIQTLQQFRHPHIAKLYGYHLSDDFRSNVCLIFELAEKGSLDRFWYDDFGRSQLSWRQRLQIAMDVATALSYLHGGGDGIKACYHRDIKSANICLNNNFQAQLIDCGLAKFVSEDDLAPASSATRKVGTPGYICPLYQSNAIAYGAKCDVFSFGIVLMELILGRLQNFRETAGSKPTNFWHLFARKRSHSHIEENFDKLAGDWDPAVITELSDLALQCLESLDEDDRPSMETVVTRLQALVSDFCHTHSKSSVVTTSASRCPTPLVAGICRTCMIQSENCLPCNKVGALSHLHCKSCLDRHVRNNIGLHEIRCPRDGCESEPFHDEQLCMVDTWMFHVTIRNINEHMALLTRKLSELYDRTEADRKEQIDVARRNHSEHIHTVAQNLNELQTSKKNLEDIRRMMVPVYARTVVRCPRLFVLVAADKPKLLHHSREWMKRMTTKNARLYFVCAHSHEVVEPPIKLTVTKEWWTIAQPAIDLALNVLNGTGLAIAGSPVSVTPLDLTDNDDDDVKELVMTTAETSPTDPNQAKELLGKAFELIADKAMEDGNFYVSMSPVFKDGDIMWVSSIYKDLYRR